MNMRQALIAALRGDPELKPRLAQALRARIDGADGRMSTVVQAAEALTPIIEDAVRKRPSRLGKLGLKSARVLANLMMEDDSSNRSEEHTSELQLRQYLVCRLLLEKKYM